MKKFIVIVDGMYTTYIWAATKYQVEDWTDMNYDENMNMIQIFEVVPVRDEVPDDEHTID